MRKNYKTQNKYDATIKAVNSTLKKLDNIKKSTENINFFLGFDGYIDSLYNMLKNRTSVTEFEIYKSMENFGNKIVATAGSSASIERVLKKKLGGGFAPNMARAIGKMAPKSHVDLYAAMGYPDINPIFESLPANISLHSIGNSGETLAMEFENGKIMSQDMGGIFDLNWKTLISHIGGRDVLIGAFEKANAIGNGHWSLMPFMNSFFKHFLSDILPNISKNNLQKKLFFVDPADLSKRSQKNIRDFLNLLKEIDFFIPVVLSLNDREAIDVSKVLKKEEIPTIESKHMKSYIEAGKNLNSVLELSKLVIHDPHFATITGKDYHFWVTEGYTSKPKFTVAAGDHFNGAILLSLLSDLSPSESLVVGNSATAIFVRTGESPSIDTIRVFISNYFEYIKKDTADLL